MKSLKTIIWPVMGDGLNALKLERQVDTVGHGCDEIKPSL